MAETFSYPELGIEIEPGSGKDSTTDTVSFQAAGSRFTLENSLRHQPAGIQTLAVTLGIKKSNKPDFTVVLLPQAAPAAAVFTRSLCPSVTILRGRRLLEGGRFRALAVNSGNANVFTPTGERDLERVAQLLSDEFGIGADETLISSTGVIGVPLPVDKFERGIPGVKSELRENNLDAAAKAILTTDLGPKTVSFAHKDWILCGMAKGAGMIEPNMATMLVYFFTNAKLSHQILQTTLHAAVGPSLNSISIDSDMSTSDTAALFTTGEAPLAEKDHEIFSAALRAMCVKLGRDIVSQGEGVSRLVECVVESDISADFSRRTAKSIINSPLLKAAIHGADPNWGRVVAAIGKVESAAPLDPASVFIEMMGKPVYSGGREITPDLNGVHEGMKNSKRITIDVKIGEPKFRSRVWGSDLTEEYVTFNSEYTS